MVAVLTVAALLMAPLTVRPAQAGDLEDARSHFQRGKERFRAGDYQGAIAEFAAADRAVPSPLNDYNIALCYDRLGDRAEALRRYRAYLEEAPGAANRAEVESVIRRLEGELRAERARAAEAEPPAPPEPAQPEPAQPQPPQPAQPEPAQPEPAQVEPPQPEPATRSGPAEQAPPAAAGRREPPRTGDPELDRVAAIDIAAVRRRRAGVAGEPSGPASPGAPSAVEPGGAPPAPIGERDQDDDEDPIYKQWWFWLVVGVSAVVLLDIATSDSDGPNATTRALDFGAAGMTPMAPAGAPVLRF